MATSAKKSCTSSLSLLFFWQPYRHCTLQPLEKVIEKDKICWENETETHITVRGNPQSKQQISSQRAISFGLDTKSLYWSQVTHSTRELILVSMEWSTTTPPWIGWQSITRLLPAFHKASLTTILQNIFTLLVGERHLYSRYVANYKTKWPDLYHS